MSKAGAKGYAYSASFAAAFGEGPATISRIWADNKLIYKGGEDFGVYAGWSSFEDYVAGDLVMFPNDPGGTMWRAKISSTGKTPGSGSIYWELFTLYPEYDSSVQYLPGSTVRINGQIYGAISPNLNEEPPDHPEEWQPIASYYPTPTVYDGTEAQTPDPLIQAAEGAANTPAFRGLCYAVWENLPLANFGNRLPIIRAELNAKLHDCRVMEKFTASGTGPATIPLVDPVEVGDRIQFQYIMSPYAQNRAITDQLGNSYDSMDLAQFNDPLFRAGAVRCRIVSVAGTPTISINFEAGAEWAVAGAVIRGISLISGNDFDGAVNWGAPGGTSADSLTATFSGPTTNASDILLSHAYALGGGLTKGEGALIGVAVSPAGYSVGMSYRIVNATAAYSTTWTQDAATLMGVSMLAQFWCMEAAVAAGGTALQDVIKDICKKAGLPAIKVDVSLVDENIKPNAEFHGYSILNQQPAVEALRHLLGAYFLDACESDGKIKFVPRSSSLVALTIPEDDLGLAEDNGKVTENLGDAQDPPRTVTIKYNDLATDYQEGAQQKDRLSRIVRSQNQETISLNLTLTGDEARRIAEVAMYLAWLESGGFNFKLWKANYMRLDPTDVVSFVYGGTTFTVRLIRTALGQGFAVDVEGVTAEAATETSP